MNFTDTMLYLLDQRVKHMLSNSYGPNNEIHKMTYDEAAEIAFQDRLTRLGDFLDAAQELKEHLSGANEELNYGD